MDHTAIVRQFLKNRESVEYPWSQYPFVTIARPSSAGGHALGREIIRQLGTKKLPRDIGSGWELFDYKLFVLLSQDPKLQISFEAMLKEEYRSDVRHFVSDLIAGRSQQYEMYKKTFEVVRLLGLLGKAVIVGRAGNFITRDLPMGVHVRIVSNLTTRIKGLQKTMDIKDDQAARLIQQQDRERANLVKDFFNKDFDDPHQYDAVFNADTMALEDIAAMVVEMVNQKLKHAIHHG